MASSLVNWLRRSTSDHDDVRPSKSAPPMATSAAGAKKKLGKKPRCVSVDECAADRRRFGTVDDDDDKEDEDDAMPEMIGCSGILKREDVLRLAPMLPSRKIGSPWRLAFNSEADGFSLQSLYRRVDLSSRGQLNCPSLLVIRDTRNRRFGAVVPDAFRIQDREKFYGSGETFVFRLESGVGLVGDLQEEGFKVWKFAHTNYYVIFCSHDCLSVGSGDGHPALQVDSDLNVGRSDRCPTYDNDPLTPDEDFVVSSLEVWTFD